MLREIVHILAIPYKATIELQRYDLSLSDAYGSWLKMELHLKNKQRRATRTGLENKLLVALSERKNRHRIFKNPLMKAALYLDPRFRRLITISHEDTDEAKETLRSISNRLIVLSEGRLSDNMNQSNESDDSFDAQKEFDRYFNRTAPVDSNIQSDFEAVLDSYDPPPMKIDASLLKYWHDSYDQQHSKLLFDVAMAILAVPPTEVAIERDFSHLKIILSDLRTNLSPQTLENILTINLNKDLYLQINENDVNELEKTHPASRDKSNAETV